MICALLIGLGCGPETPRVPTGDPLTVVKASAERTPAAGLLRVFVTGPDESLEGEVHLADMTGPAEVRERARRALEVAAGAKEARAYGGQQIRGVSTMRYEVTTREGGRADVWVSVDGLARRVQIPDGPLDASPPPTQANGLPALVTVDFLVVDGAG